MSRISGEENDLDSFINFSEKKICQLDNFIEEDKITRVFEEKDYN